MHTMIRVLLLASAAALASGCVTSKVDQMVFQSEIQFCEKIASKLGYKTEIVPELAAHIFSDSDIRKNKLALREMADEYLV